MPDALVEAIGILGARYDALIVDEAQDLATHWLTALMATLADERDDPVWLFMDDNQQVYETQLDVPREFQPFELTVNCRNTQAIHREVMKLYEGDIAPEVDRRPDASGRVATDRGARQARQARPLLVDPRLQRPRVPRRRALRAGGDRRHDDQPAAVRGDLEGRAITA